MRTPGSVEQTREASRVGPHSRETAARRSLGPTHSSRNGACKERAKAWISSTLDGSGEEHFYKLTRQGNLRIDVVGPEDRDFDVYVKRGAPPTTNDWDARSHSNAADEHLAISPAEQGEYFIMVRSYHGDGEYKLRVTVE